MKLSDMFFIVLYGIAIIFIIYFIMGMFYQPSQPTVVVVDETPVYYDSGWWPWYGSYNWYPTWFPWVGGYGGGYYGRRWGPGRWHGGGYRPHDGGRPWGGAGRGAMGPGGGGRIGGGGMGGGRIGGGGMGGGRIGGGMGGGRIGGGMGGGRIGGGGMGGGRGGGGGRR
jgi:hypothetical protein